MKKYNLKELRDELIEKIKPFLLNLLATRLELGQRFFNFLVFEVHLYHSDDLLELVRESYYHFHTIYRVVLNLLEQLNRTEHMFEFGLSISNLHIPISYEDLILVFPNDEAVMHLREIVEGTLKSDDFMDQYLINHFSMSDIYNMAKQNQYVEEMLKRPDFLRLMVWKECPDSFTLKLLST